jgi:hypothetical protein
MAGRPLLKIIVNRVLLQCRIYRLLFLLCIAVFTICPVTDAYSDNQNLSNEKLDQEAEYAGSVSEVDTSDDRPSVDNFHVNKTNTLTIVHSAINIDRDPIKSTSISDNPYYQFTGSIIPINGKTSNLTYPPLSSDPSPPVI